MRSPNSMETKNRPAHLYGKTLNYAVEILCPKCKKLQSYIPRKKGELHARINPKSTKLCPICNTRFLIIKNIIGERDIKTK